MLGIGKKGKDGKDNSTGLPEAPPRASTPQLTTRKIGHVPAKAGCLVVGDIEHFDQRWKSPSAAVITNGYAVDVRGPNAAYLAQLHPQWDMDTLADGTCRVVAPNVSHANIIMDHAKKRAIANEWPDKVEIHPVGASGIRSRDVCRAEGYGILERRIDGEDIAAFLTPRGADVVAVTDTEGKLKEIRLVLR